MEDGITLTREECQRRNDEIEEMFHRLNSATLLTMIFENLGDLVFKRNQITKINQYEMPPNDTTVNPYDPDFSDYIKDLGGHVLIKYDPQTDDVLIKLVTHEEGIESQKRGESVGFFSIRRPWNVYSIKPEKEVTQ
jgi:hypothetical protein